jgi:peroxiredoxin
VWLTAALVASGGAIGAYALGAHAVGAAEHAQERRVTPLPRFEGPKLSGEGVAGTDLLRGRRGVIYLFSSADSNAEPVATIVKNVAKEAAAANVALLGVNRDFDPERGRRFVASHGFEFTVLRDQNLAVTRKLAALNLPPGTSALLMVDAEGNFMGGFADLGPSKDPVATWEAYVRDLLKLPSGSAALSPELGTRPQAPDFRAAGADGKTVSLADLKGKVGVVVFFLPTCPHCHAMLKFLQGLSAKLAHPDLVLVPISVSDRRLQIEDMAREQGLTLAFYTDADQSAQKAYAHYLGVPDTLVIDREGRILARHQGAEPRIEALVTMEVRRALGVANPLLLPRDGFAGAEACMICHEQPHSTWSLTQHAFAFDTLVEHGVDRDPECLPCHTVGWGEKGGYQLDAPAPVTHLEGVQCENCHGRGGPHQSKDFAAGGYEKVCLGCHTEKHSLNFVFAERLPLVSHAANAQFASLSADERVALLARRDKRDRTLFQKGRFVGSESCKSCHAQQHQIWSESAHAKAFETLRAQHVEKNTDCVRCHSTGFGEEGGYPGGGPALAGVGCESCHGPGGNHVTEGARRQGTILALTDKCDSCVILQICGSCHDGKWDPDLEWNLEAKLAKIRHGMREAAKAAP